MSKPWANRIELLNSSDAGESGCGTSGLWTGAGVSLGGLNLFSAKSMEEADLFEPFPALLNIAGARRLGSGVCASLVLKVAACFWSRKEFDPCLRSALEASTPDVGRVFICG